MNNHSETLPFEGYETLSDKEKEVFELLSNCEIDSLWNLAIKNVIKSPDVAKFRRLVCQLKSQNSDNPAAMKRILGDAYDALIAL